MFKNILVPVDLSDKKILEKAISVAIDQARHYDANLTLVSVVGGLQAKVSNSSANYQRRLAEFADEISKAHNDIVIKSQIYEAADPSVEVGRYMLKAIEETSADLVIMATHQPGWFEYIVNSHGGHLATHAPISVFVVRD
jgi:nucleotide-binding universal stress UspA family protein